MGACISASGLTDSGNSWSSAISKAKAQPLEIAPHGIRRTATFAPGGQETVATFLAPDRPPYGAALRHLRENVLCCQQEVIAAIAGVNPSTVSRWEKDMLDPTVMAIYRLENFCAQHSITLSPSWLITPPRRRAA